MYFKKFFSPKNQESITYNANFYVKPYTCNFITFNVEIFIYYLQEKNNSSVKMTTNHLFFYTQIKTKNVLVCNENDRDFALHNKINTHLTDTQSCLRQQNI